MIFSVNTDSNSFLCSADSSDSNKCKMEQMLQDEGKFGLEKLFVIL